MVTCHCKTLESSTKPAEKPSIGFRVKSVLFFAFVVVVVLIRRERGKSQYKMLASPLVALLAKIIVHIVIIHHPRERQTDKTKEGQEKRRTSQLVS